VIVFKESKTFWLFFNTVSVTDLNTAKLYAPVVDLNNPDIFCFTFMFRIALSDALLSGGTSGL